MTHSPTGNDPVQKNNPPGKRDHNIERALQLPSAPYPGLRAFGQNEWTLFFGRERMTDDVIDRIGQSQFVFIHGPSGSGKSSLIRAGVIPQLQREHINRELEWCPAVMMPGSSPMYHFANAIHQALGCDREPDQALVARTRMRLNRGGAGLLETLDELDFKNSQRLFILVDQFEEIFRLEKEGGLEEAKSFIRLLTDLHQHILPNVYVALTMRSDHLGDCSFFEGLAEVVNATQYLVPPMSDREMEDAIRRPAEIYQGRVAPELAKKMIRDSRHNTDQLPLIQHALSYMWNLASDEQEGGCPTLSLSDYQESRVGSVTMALSNHAESVLTELCSNDIEARNTTERLFRALTQFDESGRAIRRRLTLQEIRSEVGGSVESLDRVIDAFKARSFLLLEDVSGSGKEPKIDISHESLIRHWQTLSDERLDDNGQPKGWIAREAMDGRVWQSLVATVETTEDSDDVYLTEAVYRNRKDWWDHRRPTPAWSNRHGNQFERIKRLFERSLQQLQKKEQLQQRARRNKKLAGLAVMLGLFAIVSLVVYNNKQLYIQKKQALKAYGEVWKYKKEAADQKDDLVKGISSLKTALLALEFLPDKNNNKKDEYPLVPEIEEQLRQSLIEYFKIDEMLVNEAPGQVDGVAIHPTGELIAIGADGGTLRLYERKENRWEVTELVGHEGDVDRIAFSPVEGNLLLSLETTTFSRFGKSKPRRKGRNSVLLWDVATKKQIKRIDLPSSSWGLAWSPDGRTFATEVTTNYSLESRHVVALWSVETGKRLKTLKGSSRMYQDIAFDPDGKMVLGASLNGTATVWDVESGSEITAFTDHSMEKLHRKGSVYGAAWSHDGNLVATGGDKFVRVWDPKSGDSVYTFCHDSPIEGIAFNSKDTQLVTGAHDGRVRIWELIPDNPIDTVSSSPLKSYDSKACSKDNRLIESYSVSFRDIDAVAWSRDGKFIVAGTDDSHAVVLHADGSVDENILAKETQPLLELLKKTAQYCFNEEERKSLGLSEEAPSWCREKKIYPYNSQGRFDRALALLRAPGPDFDLAVPRYNEALRIAPLSAEAFEDRILIELKQLAMDYLQREPTRGCESYNCTEEVRKYLQRSDDLAKIATDFEEDWAVSWEEQKIKNLNRRALRYLERTSSDYYEMARKMSIVDLFIEYGLRDHPQLMTKLNEKLYSFIMKSGKSMLQSDRESYAEEAFNLAKDYGASKNEVWRDATISWAEVYRDKQKVENSLLLALELDVKDEKVGRLFSELLEEPLIFLRDTNGMRSGPVTEVKYSQNGKFLASVSSDNTVKIWDAELLKHHKNLPGELGMVVTSITFSPDGKQLLVTTKVGTVFIWSIETGEKVEHLNLPHRKSWDCSWSADGKYIATSSSRGEVFVWSADSAEQVASTQVAEGTLANPIEFHPTGFELLIGAGDGTAVIWDPINNKDILQIQNHVEQVSDVAWSPDGMKIVTGSNDKSTYVIDVETADNIFQFRQKDSVKSIDFSPDGSMVVTVSEIGTIIVFKMENAELFYVTRGKSDDKDRGAYRTPYSSYKSGVRYDAKFRRQNRVGINDVSWSIDGRFIASGSNDGSVGIFKAPAPNQRELSLRDRALQRITRCFSRKEREYHGLPQGKPVWCPSEAPE